MDVPASTNIGPGTRLLLRLWNGRGEPGSSAESEQDWQSFLAACEHHRVSPIVFHRFQSCDDRVIPTDVLEQLRGRFYQVSAYNYRLASKLVQLISQLGSEQIPALVLKGPAVAMAAYGDLSLRQYEDIDILIPVEQVVKAVETLRALGFRPIEGLSQRHKNVHRYHEITLEAPDNSYNVDLHWHLAPPYARVFGPDVSQLWARTVKLLLPQGEVSALCREDLFLTLCQHGTRHRWWQIKWLFDIAELLRHGEQIDWCCVERSLGTLPMARQSACLAVILARELVGSQVPSQADRILAPERRTWVVAGTIRGEFLSSGQTNRSAHDTLLGLEQRPLVRARYLAVEAVQYPVRTILFTITAKDEQFVRLPEGLRMLYYLIRPLRLVFQHGRVAARRIWSMAR